MVFLRCNFFVLLLVLRNSFHIRNSIQTVFGHVSYFETAFEISCSRGSSFVITVNRSCDLIRFYMQNNYFHHWRFRFLGETKYFLHEIFIMLFSFRNFRFASFVRAIILLYFNLIPQEYFLFLVVNVNRDILASSAMHCYLFRFLTVHVQFWSVLNSYSILPLSLSSRRFSSCWNAFTNLPHRT